MTRKWANMLLLAAGAIWGMGFVAQSTAMADIGPLMFVGLRFLCATAVIFPFAFMESRKAGGTLKAADWRAFCLAGLALCGGMVTQQIGLLTTSVTNSGFLTGLYVIFVPLLVVLLFRDRPHWIVWPAVMAVFSGIWLLSGTGLDGLKTGDWLTIICAVFWALQVILVARFARRSGRPVTLAVTQFAVCGVLSTAAAPFIETTDLHAALRAAPEIVYAGVFSGGVAFTLQAIGQRYSTPAQAAIFLSSESVFAAVFAAIFLGERLAIGGLAGCALILAAILAVEVIPSLKENSSRARAS